MKASKMTKDEYIKEINKLDYNVRRRTARIEKLGVNVPQTAVESYRAWKYTRPKNLNKLDVKELKSIYRQIKDIDMLKSSRVKEAMKIKNKVIPMKDRIVSLPKNIRDKIYQVYKRFVEYTGAYDKFKYELYDFQLDLAELVTTDFDVDTLTAKLINIYDDIIENSDYNYGVSKDEISSEFREQLKELSSSKNIYSLLQKSRGSRKGN